MLVQASSENKGRSAAEAASSRRASLDKFQAGHGGQPSLSLSRQVSESLSKRHREHASFQPDREAQWPARGRAALARPGRDQGYEGSVSARTGRRQDDSTGREPDRDNKAMMKEPAKLANAELLTLASKAPAILDREKTLRHIIIACDGSEASKNAAEWTANNVARDGDVMLLTHVVSFGETLAAAPEQVAFAGGPGPPPLMNLEQRDELIKAALERNEEMLLNFAEPLVAKNVPVEVSVVVEKTLEDTAHVLSQLALDYNAELVVVGSTGKNWIERLLLGSVSHYLITKLHLPVCVVPGGAQPADEEKSSSD